MTGIDSRADYTIIRYNYIEDAEGCGIRIGGHKIGSKQYGIYNEVIFPSCVDMYISRVLLTLRRRCIGGLQRLRASHSKSRTHSAVGISPPSSDLTYYIQVVCDSASAFFSAAHASLISEVVTSYSATLAVWFSCSPHCAVAATVDKSRSWGCRPLSSCTSDLDIFPNNTRITGRSRLDQSLPQILKHVKCFVVTLVPCMNRVVSKWQS